MRGCGGAPRPAWAEPWGRLQGLALSSPALTSSSPPYSPGAPGRCWGCGGASPRQRSSGCSPPNLSGSGWPLAESPGGSCSAPTSSAWSTCGTAMLVTCDHTTSVFPLGDRADPTVCSLPAQALRDELQVVVRCHELLKVGELANARGDPIKVQLVGVQVHLLQLGQLTDGRLGKGEMVG